VNNLNSLITEWRKES